MITTVLVSIISISLGIWIQLLPSFQNQVFKRRIVGGLTFVIPVLLAGWSLIPDLVLPGYLKFSKMIFPLLGIITAIFLLNFSFAHREENISVYPQVRLRNWTLKLHFLNAFSWAVYLAGYEMLFRGFLFFRILQYGNLVEAVMINGVLYFLAHLHKGRKESWLSIPFGILLCLITLYSGNIWSAYLIHLALAVSNDYLALRAINKKLREAIFILR